MNFSCRIFFRSLFLFVIPFELRNFNDAVCTHTHIKPNMLDVELTVRAEEVEKEEAEEEEKAAVHQKSGLHIDF